MAKRPVYDAPASFFLLCFGSTLRKILTIHYSYLTETPLNAIIVVEKTGFDYSSENKVKDRTLGCQITITFSVSHTML